MRSCRCEQRNRFTSGSGEDVSLKEVVGIAGHRGCPIVGVPLELPMWTVTGSMGPSSGPTTGLTSPGPSCASAKRARTSGDRSFPKQVRFWPRASGLSKRSATSTAMGIWTWFDILPGRLLRRYRKKPAGPSMEDKSDEVERARAASEGGLSERLVLVPADSRHRLKWKA